MNYYKNDIEHIKGDTFSCGLVVEGLGQDLESAYLTCRENLNDDSEALFQKSLNNGISLVEYDEEKDIRGYAVRVAPADTSDLQAGTYYYDLQIAVNGDVFTIMYGKFIIKQDATKEGTTPVDPELYIKLILDDINGEVIGTTVVNKTNYLNQTKSLIMEALNQFFGAELTEASTFRSYADTINEIYEDYPQEEGGQS